MLEKARERNKRWNERQLLDTIVEFAGAVAKSPGPEQNGLPSYADSVMLTEVQRFERLAGRIAVCAQVGVLTREQAVTRLAIFARVGAVVTESNHADSAGWFANSALVYEAAVAAEQQDQIALVQPS